MSSEGGSAPLPNLPPRTNQGCAGGAGARSGDAERGRRIEDRALEMSGARVAVGTVELHLPDIGSLKGKRHALKGLKDTLRRRFEISVAEVDHHDVWQRATLALACVSGDSRHANEVISKAMDYIEDHVDGWVTDIQVEIL
jgi:uncharacterized protein YlxP (DUF503 family)